MIPYSRPLKQRHLSFLPAVLALTLLCAGTVAAEDDAPHPPDAPSVAPMVESGQRETPGIMTYVRSFPADMAQGTGNVFSRDNAVLFAGGVLLLGAAYAFDDPVQGYFQNERPIDHASKYGDFWGQEGVLYSTGGIVFVGAVTGSDAALRTGMAAVHAEIIAGLTTTALKRLTGRERPDGESHTSFPSGHATNAFAFAASVSEVNGNPLVLAGPLYTAAVFTAASRVQDNRHYTSDVVAGALVGTIVGKSMGRHFRTPDVSHGPQVAVEPLFVPGVQGLKIVYRF
jgi:membrane-associated phospholipid phosphatase